MDTDTTHRLNASDPIEPTPMVLPIARILEYDRNPRRERNPRYDEIKASIRAKKGLENPLTITRRYWGGRPRLHGACRR